MPSTIAPAAATGLPNIDHAATPPDPLVDLIRRYREQLACFSANIAENDDDNDALADATYMPLWDELCTSPPAPTTYAGAIAGLEFLAAELRDHLYSDALGSVLGLCLDFLRGGRQA